VFKYLLASPAVDGNYELAGGSDAEQIEDMASVAAALDALVVSAQLEEYRGYYYLPGKQSLVSERLRALAAFTGYTFSHNVGMSLLSSGSVRYRIHSSFGLTVKESAKVILFCTLSYVVGLLTVLSVVFLWMRVRIPPGFHVPFQSTRVIGFVALGLLIAYWIYMAFAHKKHNR
jgi:hypothetical protein